MPSSPSASSNALPWCWFLYPWFFATHPDDDPLLGGLHVQQPNSPPAQMLGMQGQTLPPLLPPAQTLPSEIYTHIGQFLTNAQYANLVNQHIFTQAQHGISINELSNEQLEYLLSQHLLTNSQLASLLDRNLLTLDQICQIGYPRLAFIASNRNISIFGMSLNVFVNLANTDNPEAINQFLIGHPLKRVSIFTLEQKTLLLKLNVMSAKVTQAFIGKLCTDQDLAALILEDSLTQTQLNSIDRSRYCHFKTEVIIYILNTEIDNSLLFQKALFLAGVPESGARDTQILVASLIRAIETGRWSYYLPPVLPFPQNSIQSITGALGTLGPDGGTFLLTAIFLNQPHEAEQLRAWNNFILEIYSNDQIINTVSLEAYSQWVNVIVNASGHHPLFSINGLSNERFSLINLSYFLYEIPIQTNIRLVPMGLTSIKKITYGFNSLIDLMHDFPSQAYSPFGLSFITHLKEAFIQISQLSRGRRDVLREVYRQLDWDKKVLFVACASYNPFTDNGLSLDSAVAGSSNDPPTPYGTATDSAGQGAGGRPPGSSNDPPLPGSHDEIRRLEQTTTVFTPGLNYFGKEFSLQPSDVKASLATKVNLLPYDSVHNRLLNGNDHHWYRITLSKGSIYNFNMVKEGIGNLDADLVLRETSGAVVATDIGLGGGHTQFLSVAGGRNACISFIAPTSGDYYLDASSAAVFVDSPNDMGNSSSGSFHGTGGYRLSSSLVQKMALDVGAQAVDLIEVNTDRDWYQIHLNRGERYHFKLEHNPQDGLQPLLCLRDPQGNAMLTSDSNDEFQSGPFASIDFTAVQSGDYFLDVGSSHSASTGQYRLSSSRDDVLADVTTQAKMIVGETIRGSLENNLDHDWYRVDLTAGKKYKITLQHQNDNDNLDPYLVLRGYVTEMVKTKITVSTWWGQKNTYVTIPTTTLKSLAHDDDGAGQLNSQICYTPTKTGPYFVDVGSYNNASHGEFVLSVL